MYVGHVNFCLYYHHVEVTHIIHNNYIFIRKEFKVIFCPILNWKKLYNRTKKVYTYLQKKKLRCLSMLQKQILNVLAGYVLVCRKGNMICQQGYGYSVISVHSIRRDI